MMDIVVQAAELRQDVMMALDMRRKIIQLDEFVITKRTWPTHVWTQQKVNMKIDQSEAYTETYAVLLAVSREKGIELVDIYEKSINKVKFKHFLDRLRQLNFYDDMMLMMDNISFHKSQDTKNRMDELGFQYTYTPVYSPQYNGIEEVIGIGKAVVKKRRLEMILNNK